jgi:hypothetical protein
MDSHKVRLRFILVATAQVLCFALLPAVRAAATHTVPANCLGQSVTIAGTDGPDDGFDHPGTSGADTMGLGGGLDYGHGFGGADRICTNGDYDYLYGGNGNDHLDPGTTGGASYGEDDDDEIEGSGFYDHSEGGAESDVIRGEELDDSLYGNGGANDLLNGGPDSDYLADGDGRDDQVNGNTGSSDTWAECADGVFDGYNNIDVIMGPLAGYC